jgi:hypothetical protein
MKSLEVGKLTYCLLRTSGIAKEAMKDYLTNFRARLTI